MNSSLFTADRLTHLKIVVVALVAATLVAGIGVAARVSQYEGETSLQASGPPLKAGKPMSAASSSQIAVH